VDSSSQRVTRDEAGGTADFDAELFEDGFSSPA
jgi:hypothetical protein